MGYLVKRGTIFQNTYFVCLFTTSHPWFFVTNALMGSVEPNDITISRYFSPSVMTLSRYFSP
jgi:hypothetical protein